MKRNVKLESDASRYADNTRQYEKSLRKKSKYPTGLVDRWDKVDFFTKYGFDKYRLSRFMNIQKGSVIVTPSTLILITDITIDINNGKEPDLSFRVFTIETDVINEGKLGPQNTNQSDKSYKTLDDLYRISYGKQVCGYEGRHLTVLLEEFFEFMNNK